MKNLPVRQRILPGQSLYWVTAGIFLLGIVIILSIISHRFDIDVPALRQPILALTALLCAGGTAYLVTILWLPRFKIGKGILIWMFVVGLLLRVITLTSTPMLEVDFNRYLWDGAITANGLNPYSFSPDEVIQSSEDVPPQYVKLAKESDGIVERINHSQLRTIYPPITQAAFGLAHWLRPWSLDTWRFVLLAFDFATILLLFALLRQLRLSPVWLTIYWWNPLLVKEVYNSGHMDVLVLPFVLAAVLLLFRSRGIWAIVFLALAVGVKLWPVALLPLFLRKNFASLRKLILSVGIFGAVALVLLSPMYLSGLDASSGIAAYGQRWQLNDTLFKLTVWGSQLILEFVQIHPGYRYAVARWVVLALLVFWIGFVVSRKQEKPEAFVEHCLWVSAAIFFLIPTQFPWYFIWLIPFLAIRPRVSFLLLTALLPLYYLRYYFDARGSVEVFDYGIVWLEFVPVWILLIREWYLAKKNKYPLFAEAPSAVEI